MAWYRIQERELNKIFNLTYTIMKLAVIYYAEYNENVLLDSKEREKELKSLFASDLDIIKVEIYQIEQRTKTLLDTLSRVKQSNRKSVVTRYLNTIDSLMNESNRIYSVVSTEDNINEEGDEIHTEEEAQELVNRACLIAMRLTFAEFENSDLSSKYCWEYDSLH